MAESITRRGALLAIAGTAGTAWIGMPAFAKCAITGAANDGANLKKLRLAFVTNNPSDFWRAARAGCKKAEEETPEITVDFEIPATGTSADQDRILLDLAGRGIDGIAVSPVDPSNQTKILNEIADRAFLLTQDSDAPNSKRACYVGTDNVASGRQAGDLVKKALPDGGEIMVFVGKKEAQNAKERFDGLKDSLKGSNVEILDILEDYADRVRAIQNADDALKNHPDLGAMVGLWSYNGPAILKAVKGANKAGKVKIVCFDEEPDTLAGVQAGDIFATIVQQPFEFGRLSIELMAAVLRGDKSAIPADKFKAVPVRVVRKDNVEEYQAALKKQLAQ
jgi:ribose transport system substrate-binding protein